MSDADLLKMTLGLGRGGAWDDFTDSQLKRAWTAFGDEVLAYWRSTPGCPTRPWGWWKYEQREARPNDEWAEALRLLELGELDDGERERVRRRAQAALADIERTEEALASRALVVSPASALEAGRKRRDRDAVGWRAVLDALGGKSNQGN